MNKLYSIVLGIIKLFSRLIPMDLLRKIPVKKIVTLHFPGPISIKIDSDEYDTIISNVYWRGMEEFEPETIRAFIHLLKHVNTVCDIGAFTGIYSLIAGIEKSSRTVYAFEPVPQIFERLKRNVYLNRANNVHIFSKAVSDGNGEISLWIPAISAISETSGLEKYCENRNRITVPAVRLDSFAVEHQFPKIDLIKIDIEGMEDKALAGAENILRKDRPLIICEVLKDSNEKALQNIVNKHRYQFFWITGKGLVKKEVIEGDPKGMERDYLFIPQERENLAVEFARPMQKSTST